jgi:hypothetical protein
MSYRINILINYNPIPVVKAKTDRYSNSAFSEKISKLRFNLFVLGISYQFFLKGFELPFSKGSIAVFYSYYNKYTLFVWFYMLYNCIFFFNTWIIGHKNNYNNFLMQNHLMQQQQQNNNKCLKYLGRF